MVIKDISPKCCRMKCAGWVGGHHPGRSLEVTASGGDDQGGGVPPRVVPPGADNRPLQVVLLAVTWYAQPNRLPTCPPFPRPDSETLAPCGHWTEQASPVTLTVTSECRTKSGFISLYPLKPRRHKQGERNQPKGLRSTQSGFTEAGGLATRGRAVQRLQGP